MGRLGFVSCLLQYLFKIILDRGSLDFRAIGGRDGGEKILAGVGWSWVGGWRGKNTFDYTDVDGCCPRRVDLRIGHNVFW